MPLPWSEVLVAYLAVVLVTTTASVAQLNNAIQKVNARYFMLIFLILKLESRKIVILIVKWADTIALRVLIRTIVMYIPLLTNCNGGLIVMAQRQKV